MKKRSFIASSFAAALLTLSTVLPASALTLVTNRADLGANDYIDWGTLGSSYTTFTAPFTITSNSGGVAATVTQPGDASFERRDQIDPNSSCSGWGGNFAGCDALLWNQDATGEIDIAFNQPVQGAGAQVQRDIFGGFTATIAAYDVLNNLLGSYDVAGTSDSAGDNSAIFVGVLGAGISKIVYTVDGGANGFAINRLDLVTESAIPEPASLALLGIGLASFGYMRRPSKKA